MKPHISGEAISLLFTSLYVSLVCPLQSSTEVTLLFAVLGSVSSEDPTLAMAAPQSETEPGYVEILGGEEPPDEWMNIGSRRERVDSSSSSSDGSGFQYIPAAGHRIPDQQQPPMSVSHPFSVIMNYYFN